MHFHYDAVSDSGKLRSAENIKKDKRDLKCASRIANVCTLEPLQRVQYAAARLMFGLGCCDHVMPSLIQLH